MTWPLKAEGHAVNVKRVRRLMRLIGLMPIYRQPRTSIPAKGHKLYPYLLRSVGIDRPNQVWCADITYIPLAKGFLYLVAIMDWWSRKVLAWRLSNTMDTCMPSRAGGRPVRGSVTGWSSTIIGALMPRMVARRRSKYIEQGCWLTVRAYARPSTRQPWQRNERQSNPDR